MRHACAAASTLTLTHVECLCACPHTEIYTHKRDFPVYKIQRERQILICSLNGKYPREIQLYVRAQIETHIQVYGVLRSGKASKEPFRYIHLYVSIVVYINVYTEIFTYVCVYGHVSTRPNGLLQRCT